MKKRKRIVSLILAFCLCLGLSSTAFASELKTAENNKFGLPDDAVVLHEEEGFVLYQSEAESAIRNEAVASAQSDVDYESVWLNRSGTGNFPIYCSHSGRVGVTIGVESSSESSWAQIWIKRPDGTRYLYANGANAIHPSNGEVLMRMADGTIGTYTVYYQASTTVGMRIMCWMYNY